MTKKCADINAGQKTCSSRPYRGFEINCLTLFGVLGPQFWTGSSMLDCHVLKGFDIYMIGILGSLSDVMLHIVHSSCNLLVNIKGS